MGDTLWILRLLFRVVLDTAEQDPVQALARHQETGVHRYQHATKVKNLIYWLINIVIKALNLFSAALSAYSSISTLNQIRILVRFRRYFTFYNLQSVCLIVIPWLFCNHLSYQSAKKNSYFIVIIIFIVS